MRPHSLAVRPRLAGSASLSGEPQVLLRKCAVCPGIRRSQQKRLRADGGTAKLNCNKVASSCGGGRMLATSVVFAWVQRTWKTHEACGGQRERGSAGQQQRHRRQRQQQAACGAAADSRQHTPQTPPSVVSLAKRIPGKQRGMRRGGCSLAYRHVLLRLLLPGSCRCGVHPAGALQLPLGCRKEWIPHRV